MQKLILVVLFSIILLTATIATAEAANYKKTVNKFLRANTLGGSKLSDLCFIIIGVEGNKTSLLKLNNPDCEAQPEPEPQPCPTGTFFNETSKECQPNPQPEPVPCEVTNTCPEPEPNPQPSNTTKVIVVGDVADSSSGNAVYNSIKKQNADYVFVLGDLGYSSSLSWFKSTYGTSEKVYCVLGNHEADNEDGNAALEKETKQFCGNSYWIKNGATLFVMLNTNDPNLSALATKTGQVFSNSTIMQGVKAVHVMSHKPCAVPPNSHHPVEIKSFCDAVKSKIPSGVKVFYDQAHNHVMSQSADGTYKQIGSGGKSHYTCGTSSAFPFCNNSKYGYLVYEIQPDGTTTSQFLDSNGGKVN